MRIEHPQEVLSPREMRPLQDTNRLTATALAVLLMIWISVAFAQSILSSVEVVTPAILGLGRLLMSLGYLTVPASLGLAVAVAFAYAWRALPALDKRRIYLSVLVVGTLIHAGFYAYATGMVGPPDSNVSTPAYGFAVFSAVWGPLALWPDIEYLFPSAGVGGYISVGTGMVLVSLSLLMGLNAVLFYAKIRYLRVRACVSGVTLGAVVSTLGTSFCCCCTPLLVPLIALFAGSAFTSYVAFQLVNPISLLFNLVIVSNLSLLVAGPYFSGRWISTRSGSRPDTCLSDSHSVAQAIRRTSR